MTIEDAPPLGAETLLSADAPLGAETLLSALRILDPASRIAPNHGNQRYCTTERCLCGYLKGRTLVDKDRTCYRLSQALDLLKRCCYRCD